MDVEMPEQEEWIEDAQVVELLEETMDHKD